MEPIREKRHRLADEVYRGSVKVCFTMCIRGRVPFFVDENIFKTFELFLLNKLAAFKCEAFIYLFMPDHLHAIISGTHKDSDIKKCVDRFKQASGFWLKQNTKGVKWQKDYYDHIIRNEEDLRNQINYILMNPVKANLIDHWKGYPFKGSTVLELADFV